MENPTTKANEKNILVNKTLKSINWSKKVIQLDKTIRKEIGIDCVSDAKNILIKVQTKSPEYIEPAFIVEEDDLFLELFVLSPDNGGIISTAVLKDNIQSIGVIGGVSSEKKDIDDISSELLNDFEGLYQ